MDYEKLQREIERKNQQKSRRKKIRMKVSGASVKKLQKIIIKRAGK
ncbi:MAG: hypothetical protein WCV50_04415 [Patescibacteria group bacterium]|jgi:hypothetical protein